MDIQPDFLDPLQAVCASVLCILLLSPVPLFLGSLSRSGDRRRTTGSRGSNQPSCKSGPGETGGDGTEACVEGGKPILTYGSFLVASRRIRESRLVTEQNHDLSTHVIPSTPMTALHPHRRLRRQARRGASIGPFGLRGGREREQAEDGATSKVPAAPPLRTAASSCCAGQ